MYCKCKNSINFYWKCSINVSYVLCVSLKEILIFSINTNIFEWRNHNGNELIWQWKFRLHLNRSNQHITPKNSWINNDASYTTRYTEKDILHIVSASVQAKNVTSETMSVRLNKCRSAAVIGFTWAAGGTYFNQKSHAPAKLLLSHLLAHSLLFGIPFLS